MIDLKACTRCGGDMMAEEILGDVDLVCLQCGYRKAMPQAGPVWRVNAVRRQRTPQRRAA
jgi:DNA-directed RNA polymerase subunit RPC12/RpoP